VRKAFRLHRRPEGVLDKDRGSRAESEWGALLAAAQQGDGAAYRDFLTSILPFVRSIARRRAWSEDMAEDVVQDVLLTVHRIRHTYQPGRPVKPWLAAIAARRAVDAMRRRGRQSAREVHDEAAYETFADPQANQSEAGEAAESLARMMTDLTPRQKEALDLVKLKEMSLADASAQSGQSVASLKVNVHRAIGRLRRGLGGGEAE
jgi:RNA polymerase sigma-70 factor (ECF subfamily)